MYLVYYYNVFSLLSTIVTSDFIRIYFDKGRSASCAQGVTGVAAVAAFTSTKVYFVGELSLRPAKISITYIRTLLHYGPGWRQQYV